MGVGFQPPLPRRRPQFGPLARMNGPAQGTGSGGPTTQRPTTQGTTQGTTQAAGQGNQAAVEQANMVVATASTDIPQQYAGKSAVWKSGYRDGLAQARDGLANIEGDATTRSAIADASTATGVDIDNLTAMAIIESTGNRSIGTNGSGYTGLMQMGSEATREVGMRFSSVKGASNVANNALAGAKYWNLNDERLGEDVPRDPLHMYLAHQQGAGGTTRLHETLQTNPTAAATGAQKGNLPEALRATLGKNITQQDFYDYWAGKMQAIQDALAARNAAP